MNRFLHIVRQKGLSFKCGLDYDEYVSVLEDADVTLKGADPKIFDELIGMVSDITSDHMSAYLEAFCDVLSVDALITVFAKYIYCDNQYRRMMVLDLVELTEHKEYFDLFDANKVVAAQDVSRYASVIIALLKRHPDLVNANSIELLHHIYDSDVANHTKYDIWKLSQSIRLGFSRYQGFIDYDYEKLVKQQPQLVKRAHQHFKDKKFKAALNILQQYREEDLSAFGKKVLTMTKKQLHVHP